MADDNARYWPYLKLRLFKKSFPKGPVELGGNGGAGSMYIVLLENNGDSCTLLNDKNVVLSWYPNEDKVDGYRIYVKSEAELAPVVSVEYLFRNQRLPGRYRVRSLPIGMQQVAPDSTRKLSTMSQFFPKINRVRQLLRVSAPAL